MHHYHHAHVIIEHVYGTYVGLGVDWLMMNTQKWVVVDLVMGTDDTVTTTTFNIEVWKSTLVDWRGPAAGVLEHRKSHPHSLPLFLLQQSSTWDWGPIHNNWKSIIVHSSSTKSSTLFGVGTWKFLGSVAMGAGKRRRRRRRQTKNGRE